MLSKNKIKFIRSLEQKKYRRQEGAFIAEGPKCVGDLLYAGFTPLLIVATEDWKCTVGLPAECEQITTSKEELKKASLLLNPQQVICVFRMPQEDGLPSPTIAQSELVLCLDGIQDPGNLGTIIRTADWFGIKNIVCSNTTADAFAPKVVQATMGSIARERIFYADIPQFLGSLPAGTPVYGTFLNGESIYDTDGGYIPEQEWGVTTQNGNTLYVHVLNPVETVDIEIPAGNKIQSVTTFSGTQVGCKTRKEGGRTIASFTVPEGPAVDNVLKVTFKKTL